MRRLSKLRGGVRIPLITHRRIMFEPYFWCSFGAFAIPIGIIAGVSYGVYRLVKHFIDYAKRG